MDLYVPWSILIDPSSWPPHLPVIPWVSLVWWVFPAWPEEPLTTGTILPEDDASGHYLPSEDGLHLPWLFWYTFMLDIGARGDSDFLLHCPHPEREPWMPDSLWVDRRIFPITVFILWSSICTGFCLLRRGHSREYGLTHTGLVLLFNFWAPFADRRWHCVVCSLDCIALSVCMCRGLLYSSAGLWHCEIATGFFKF